MPGLTIFMCSTRAWQWAYENASGDCSMLFRTHKGYRRITWIDDPELNEGSGRIVYALSNGYYGCHPDASLSEGF